MNVMTQSDEPDFKDLITELNIDYKFSLSNVLDKVKKHPCINYSRNNCRCLYNDMFHYPNTDTYVGGKITCPFKHGDNDVEFFLGVKDSWIICYNTKTEHFHFENGNQVYEKDRCECSI